MPMNTNRRSALGAITIGLSAILFAACSAATPSASPSPSGSPNPATSTPSTASPSVTPAPTPAPTPTPQPTPVVTPLPTPRSGSLVVNWTKSATAAAGPGLSYTSFDSPTATLGARTVIAQHTEGSDPGPLFWYSDDGLHWTKASTSDAASESIWASGVTVGGPGFVAVGTDLSADPDGSKGVIAIWTSSDGAAWTRARTPSLGAGELQTVATVAGGLIAFGSDGKHGAIYASSNGTDWSSVAVPAGFDPWDAKVLAEADGSLTVIDIVSDADKSPLDVWRATSPTAWTKVGTLPQSAGGRVQHLVHGPLGWLASGTVVWTSVDGVKWSVATKGQPEFRSLVADAGGFIGVGFRVTSAGCVYGEYDTIGETWTSADGRTWRHMPEDPKQNHGSIGTLVLRGQMLYGLALGFAGEDAPRSVVWTTDLSGFGAGSDQEPAPKPTHTPAPAGGCGP